jgi:hypothetical protein
VSTFDIVGTSSLASNHHERGRLDHSLSGDKAVLTGGRRKCKACVYLFRVTAGTIFASRKLPIRDYLMAIAIIANGAKGISALQLGRDLDVQYRTAFVMAHKIREAMASETKGATLSGEVDVDGMYTGGSIRPANKKEDRVDRRLARNQTGKRRVVVVARERKGRTLTTVTKSEADGVGFVRAAVTPGSIVNADEAGHWDQLHAFFETRRINHQEAYSLNGAHTNWAESFLARLRRMIGNHAIRCCASRPSWPTSSMGLTYDMIVPELRGEA